VLPRGTSLKLRAQVGVALAPGVPVGRSVGVLLGTVGLSNMTSVAVGEGSGAVALGTGVAVGMGVLVGEDAGRLNVPMRPQRSVPL